MAVNFAKLPDLCSFKVASVAVARAELEWLFTALSDSRPARAGLSIGRM